MSERHYGENHSDFVLYFTGKVVNMMALRRASAWGFTITDMSVWKDKLYLCAGKDGLLEYGVIQ